MDTIEGYIFFFFELGMKGNYQHCTKKHLCRFRSELELRYNNRAAQEE